MTSSSRSLLVLSAISVVQNSGYLQLEEQHQMLCLSRLFLRDTRVWSTIINKKHRAEKQTRLIRQCKSGPTACIYRLVALNADVNSVDIFGDNALLMAAWRGRLDVAAALIIAGAEVNHCNQRGRSPLQLAVMGKNVPMARLLLSAGADANLLPPTDRQTLESANLITLGPHKDTETLLVQAEAALADERAAFMAAAKAHSAAFAKLVDQRSQSHSQQQTQSLSLSQPQLSLSQPQLSLSQPQLSLSQPHSLSQQRSQQPEQVEKQQQHFQQQQFQWQPPSQQSSTPITPFAAMTPAASISTPTPSFTLWSPGFEVMSPVPFALGVGVGVGLGGGGGGVGLGGGVGVGVGLGGGGELVAPAIGSTTWPQAGVNLGASSLGSFIFPASSQPAPMPHTTVQKNDFSFPNSSLASVHASMEPSQCLQPSLLDTMSLSSLHLQPQAQLEWNPHAQRDPQHYVSQAIHQTLPTTQQSLHAQESQRLNHAPHSNHTPWTNNATNNDLIFVNPATGTTSGWASNIMNTAKPSTPAPSVSSPRAGKNVNSAGDASSNFEIASPVPSAQALFGTTSGNTDKSAAQIQQQSVTPKPVPAPTTLKFGHALGQISSHIDPTPVVLVSKVSHGKVRVEEKKDPADLGGASSAPIPVRAAMVTDGATNRALAVAQKGDRSKTQHDSNRSSFEKDAHDPKSHSANHSVRSSLDHQSSGEHPDDFTLPDVDLNEHDTDHDSTPRGTSASKDLSPRDSASISSMNNALDSSSRAVQQASTAAKSVFRLVPYRLPKMNIYLPNGQLDSRDDRVPPFKPGSVNDSDWVHRAEELGTGMENSYGLVLDDKGNLQPLMVHEKVVEKIISVVPAKPISQIRAASLTKSSAEGLKKYAISDSVMLPGDVKPDSELSPPSLSVQDLSKIVEQVKEFKESILTSELTVLDTPEEYKETDDAVIGPHPLVHPFDPSVIKSPTVSKRKAHHFATAASADSESHHRSAWRAAPFTYGQTPPSLNSPAAVAVKSVLKKDFAITQPSPQFMFVDGLKSKIKLLPPRQAVAVSSPLKTNLSKGVSWTEGEMYEVLNLHAIADDPTFDANPNIPLSPKEKLPLYPSELQVSPIQMSINAKFWNYVLQEEQLEALGPPVLDVVLEQQRLKRAQELAAKKREYARIESQKAIRVNNLADELIKRKQELILAQAKGAATAKRNGAMRPGEAVVWKEYFSAEHKRSYWFNRITNESTWERPQK